MVYNPALLTQKEHGKSFGPSLDPKTTPNLVRASSSPAIAPNPRRVRKLSLRAVPCSSLVDLLLMLYVLSIVQVLPHWIL